MELRKWITKYSLPPLCVVISTVIFLITYVVLAVMRMLGLTNINLLPVFSFYSLVVILCMLWGGIVYVLHKFVWSKRDKSTDYGQVTANIVDDEGWE